MAVLKNRKYGRCPACGGILALEEHHADIDLSVYVCIECHHWYLTSWDIEAGLIKPHRKDDDSRRQTASVDHQLTGLCRIFILMCQRYNVPQGAELFRTLDFKINGLRPSRSRARRVGRQRRESEYGDDLVMTHNMAGIQSAMLERTVAREAYTPFGVMMQTILGAFRLIEDYPLEFGRYLDTIDLTDLRNITNEPPKAYDNSAFQRQQEENLSLVITPIMTGFLTYMRNSIHETEKIDHE